MVSNGYAGGKKLKGQSQTVLFTGKTSTSTTPEKYTVSPIPQIPDIPPMHTLKNKDRQNDQSMKLL